MPAGSAEVMRAGAEAATPVPVSRSVCVPALRSRLRRSPWNGTPDTAAERGLSFEQRRHSPRQIVSCRSAEKDGEARAAVARRLVDGLRANSFTSLRFAATHRITARKCNRFSDVFRSAWDVQRFGTARKCNLGRRRGLCRYGPYRKVGGRGNEFS